MAIYKNREVNIVSYITDESPVVEVQHLRSGDREMVKLNELQITEEEKKQFKDQDFFNRVNVISDKDLQDLRDSQDPKKIEAKKQNKDKDVSVSHIKVNADEVLRKAR